MRVGTMADGIWRRQVNLDELNRSLSIYMTKHLGIRFTTIGPDFLEATMPVDERTKQPFGKLHGGASAALSETLASVAAHLCTGEGHSAAGVEINANHVRSVDDGVVTGRAQPVYIGSRIQVWRVEIRRADGRIVCESRVTLLVIDERGQAGSVDGSEET